MSNTKFDLSKENEKFVKLMMKKEKVSFNQALNKLVEIGFEFSYALNEKEINRKIGKSSEGLHKESSVYRKKSSRLVSLITLITSITGILLGIIYVLYIEKG